MIFQLLTLMALSIVVASSSNGCGINHHVGYHTNGGAGYSIESSGNKRTYTIVVPELYDPNTPSGVIISYHGHGSYSDKQHDLTQLGTRYNPNYLSVFPQGLDGTDGKSAWEGASYAAEGCNDIQFTADLLDHLREKYCVDDRRIYASGKSNGGGFVDTLACSDVGTQFAAFSSCSGAFYTDNALSDCARYKDGSAMAPYMEFHGSVDTTVPYEGKYNSTGGDEPPIPTWLGFWGSRNDCSASTNVFPSQYNGAVNHTIYECNGREVVQGYWVQGMGHSWPSTQSNADNKAHGDGPTVLDATPILLDFFGMFHLNTTGRP